jgi:hypothetical protein
MRAEELADGLNGLDGTIVSHLPLAGRSIQTARALADSVAIASDSAISTLPVLRTQSFWQAGRLSFDALRQLRLVAQQQAPRVSRARDLVERSPAWPLPGPLARARNQALERLAGSVNGLDVATKAVDLSETMLGASSHRAYLILFENPAEMRGAGGMWGNYGVIFADNARLTLGKFGRAQEELGEFATNKGPAWYEDRYAVRFGASGDWRQMGTAPDFPTVASLAERDIRTAQGIGPVDGIIGIDPIGIAALLKITGPVRVASWPEPITAENVVRVTMHDAYSAFDNNEDRIAFIGETARVVWSELVRGDIGIAAISRSGLGAAIDGKHLRMHFVRTNEQALSEELNATGGLGDPSNTIGLVTQNMSANKMDYWLERDLDVRLNLESDGSATGSATVSLTNRGPSTGEPRYVIGPFNDLLKPGQNTQYVRLYLPGTASVRPSRSSEGVQLAYELGFVVVEWEVPILAGQTAKRRVSFVLDDFWSDDRFDLTIRRQQAINPDDVEVDVSPPWGRRIRLEPDPSCAPASTDRDIDMRAGVTSWLPGWILGPWARDATCGK